MPTSIVNDRWIGRSCPKLVSSNQYYRFNGASAVIQITAFGVARAAADQSVVIVQEHFTVGLILLLSLPDFGIKLSKSETSDFDAIQYPRSVVIGSPGQSPDQVGGGR